MKRKAFISLSLAGLLVGLYSFLFRANDVLPEQASLLWKIEGNGLKQPSYLFGTMHLIEKEYFYFPPGLEKIIKKSSVIVMELPGLPNQVEAMQYVTLKEGSFFDYFTPEQTDTILRWAEKRLGMSEEIFRASFAKMKPFVVVQAATQMQFIGKTESYEMTLGELAEKNGIRLEGLETIADQMKIFDDLTKEQQAEMVMAGIRDEEETNRLTRDMQGVYRRQRIDSLYALIRQEGGVIAEEQNAFLDGRNRNWIPKIKTYIVEGKAFIAVGAGHLGGENGVIRLLEKEGYTITPVKI